MGFGPPIAFDLIHQDYETLTAASKELEEALRHDSAEVIADGKSVDLTATEFSLMKLLMSRPGRVYTRQLIIESIHPNSFFSSFKRCTSSSNSCCRPTTPPPPALGRRVAFEPGSSWNNVNRSIRH